MAHAGRYIYVFKICTYSGGLGIEPVDESRLRHLVVLLHLVVHHEPAYRAADRADAVLGPAHRVLNAHTERWKHIGILMKIST